MSESMSMEIRCLETILNYEMTSMEAKAYKIACLFKDNMRRACPDQMGRANRGDPRKTYLFKCCYKLLREKDRQIEDSDYPLYVRAQFDILKSMTKKNKDYLLCVTPSCLLGERAWKRWYLWKKLYDYQIAQPLTAEERGVDRNDEKRVTGLLMDDKEFLTTRLKELTRENVEKAVEGRALLRWVANGQLSPYYALLSPVLHEWLKDHKLTVDSIFHIDFGLYEPGLTEGIKEFFHVEYQYEFEVAR